MLLEKIDSGSIVWLLVSLFLLYIGYEDWKNREEQPTRITVADYVKSDKSKKWVVLTDAKINLLDAVTKTTTSTYQMAHVPVGSTEAFSLYIPIKSAGFTQNDTVSLLLETNDKEILDVARQLKAMSEAKSEAELLQFIVREKDKLIRSVELSGLTERGNEGEKIRQHIKNLASNFYILKHNSAMSLTGGWGSMGAGLFMLTAFIFYLFSLHLKAKERKATKTAAAQARMQEIKAITEAYENRSKPETRATYDSQGQAAKSPRPPSSSIIIPPQKDDVVVEQNSVSLPDKDKSQVSPYRRPPDYYKILGISHAADLQEIKQAVQTKAQEIKTAFTVLSQAETRTAYNANLSYAETRTAYDAKLNQWPHNHYVTLAVSREVDLAKIKTAAQARMNDLKEAYETLSKPNTRAAYDFQWQPVKPITPVVPSKPKEGT